MVRAAYNDAMDVYTNDGAYGPDVFRFNADCRVVPQPRTVSRSPPWNQVDAYITWNGPSVSAGGLSIVAGGYDVDTTTADIIIQTSTGLGFLVLRTEIVLPKFGVAYRRAWVTNIF